MNNMSLGNILGYQPLPLVLEKVISGGQTGIDQLSLLIASMYGLEIGGTAPKNYRTERGYEEMLASWGLVEDFSSEYPPRTLKNIQAAEATILLGDETTPGSKLTLKYIKQEQKPYLVNPTAEDFLNFLRERQIKILNLAGNRRSVMSAEDYDQYQALLLDVFSNIY